MGKSKKGDKGANKKEGRITKPYKEYRFCPKCGPGVHLAEHKDRRACGKCGYMEKK